MTSYHENKTKFVGAHITPTQQKTLLTLARKLKANKSEVVRRLIVLGLRHQSELTS